MIPFLVVSQIFKLFIIITRRRRRIEFELTRMFERVRERDVREMNLKVQLCRLGVLFRFVSFILGWLAMNCRRFKFIRFLFSGLARLAGVLY